MGGERAEMTLMLVTSKAPWKKQGSSPKEPGSSRIQAQGECTCFSLSSFILYHNLMDE